MKPPLSLQNGSDCGTRTLPLDHAMPTFRNIAVTVVHPAPGNFQWRLLETAPSGQGQWTVVSESRIIYSEWLDAFNAGIDEVMVLTTDGRYGPQNP